MQTVCERGLRETSPFSGLAGSSSGLAESSFGLAKSSFGLAGLAESFFTDRPCF